MPDIAGRDGQTVFPGDGGDLRVPQVAVLPPAARWSYPGRAKVLALRDFKPLKPEQMIHQVHLWLGADGTEDQGAGFGFEDRERRPVPIPVLVSDFLRHHDLALLAHVNHGHSRKLSPERPYSNPFLSPRLCSTRYSTGCGWNT